MSHLEASAESSKNKIGTFPAIPITSVETAALATTIAIASEYTNRSLPPLTIDAVNYAQSKFSQMDGNNDGKVSHHELDGYIKANQSGMSKEETALVYQIKDHRQRIANASHDGAGQAFTQQDLYHTKNRFTPEQRAAAQSEGVADLRPALSYANKNMDKLDSDKNGFVNNDEIAKYIAEQNVTAEEKAMLRSLRDNSSRIQQSNNDGDKPQENRGFSQKDLSASNNEINNLSFASENFTAMDADGNGHITRDEITGYERARPNLKGEELRALDALRNNVGKLEDNHDDELFDDNDGYTGHDVLDGLVSWGSPTAKGMRKLEDSVSTPAAPKPDTPAPEAPKNPTDPTDPKDPKDPKDPADDPQDPAKPEKPEDNVQRSHTIERGDTIWRICADELRSRSGKSPSHMEIIGAVEAVKKMNPDVDPYRLRAGDELKIPKDLSCPPGAEFIPHPRPPRRPVEPPIAVPRRPPVEPPIAAPPDERPGPVPPIESRPPLEREREPEMTNADVLREHWDGIDRDSNGKVSREEINEYRRVMSRYLSDKQDDALRLMAQNEHKIQELVNDEKGDENSGISLADLRKAEVMQTAARYFQSKNLDMINFNGDRFIDQRELHYASNSPYVTARDQQMLKVLRAYYAKFQEGSNNEDGDENSGITRHDLRYYSNLI